MLIINQTVVKSKHIGIKFDDRYISKFTYLTYIVSDTTYY